MHIHEYFIKFGSETSWSNNEDLKLNTKSEKCPDKAVKPITIVDRDLTERRTMAERPKISTKKYLRWRLEIHYSFRLLFPTTECSYRTPSGRDFKSETETHFWDFVREILPHKVLFKRKSPVRRGPVIGLCTHPEVTRLWYTNGSSWQSIWVKGREHPQAAVWGTHPTLPGEFRSMNDADHKMTKEERDNKGMMVKYLDICWESHKRNLWYTFPLTCW